MRPLLGELLAAASEHIGAATSDALRPPTEATGAVVTELARLTAMMARSPDAFVTDDHTGPPDPPDAQALAILDARSALRHAAARTHTAAGTLGNSGNDAHHRSAARLASATACLAAGHDLLQSHFTPEQPGTRHGTSLWAPAIVSAPVHAALVTVMGGYAGQLAPWTLQLATAPSNMTLPEPARVALTAAGRWLRIAEAAAWALSHQPGAIAEQALLRAIPVNIPPPRRSPHGGEPLAELSAGAIATAERLRHLAHAPPTRPGTARAGLAVAWQRTAQGAAITGHCSELILRQLAEPAAQVPVPPTANVALKEAAHQIRRAWAAWRAAAHAWDTLTTGPGATLTPVATTTTDLTLWVGRLTYTGPAWIPARTHTSTLRPGNAFANDGAITGVVAAVHQACDALAHIAAHDREQVRSAAADGDLYLPTRLLPAECDVPYRYVPAHPATVDTLLTQYDAVIHAAIRAVTALDDLALTLDPHPTTFATLRTIAPLTTAHTPGSPAPLSGESALRPRPGRLEQEIRRRGITEPTLLARATDIDDATQDLISAVMTPSQRRAAADQAALQDLEHPPAHSQHPARLAAEDVPPYTASNTPLPKLIPLNHQIRHRARTRPQRRT
jgi:hypothetical protein